METTHILIGSAALLIIYTIVLYNKLVTLKLNRENAFADIDTQLKQRFELIPQLINTVKGAKDFEKEVLTQVTEARSKAMGASSIADKIEGEKMMGVALSGFFAVAEAYPDIKSNQNFLSLQSEISDIENKLAAARRFFNSSTNELNQGAQQFPSNIVAKLFGFKEEEFFEIENRETMDKAPKISFD